MKSAQVLISVNVIFDGGSFTRQTWVRGDEASPGFVNSVVRQIYDLVLPEGYWIRGLDWVRGGKSGWGSRPTGTVKIMIDANATS